MAVFGAVIRDHTPENRAGMFQGLRIVAQVLIPGIIGPAIGAAVLKNAEQIMGDDGTLSFVPNQNIFIAALVVTVVLAAFLCGVFAIMKRMENKNEK
jgi:MFS family permease